MAAGAAEGASGVGGILVANNGVSDYSVVGKVENGNKNGGLASASLSSQRR